MLDEMMEAMRNMHEKFELEYEGPPRSLDPDEQKFRIVALLEEVYELEAAMATGDLAESQDAICDLIVFAVGTAYRMGLWNVSEGMSRVHQANMMKELASSASASKRGFSRDLVKPEGWVSPTHGDLV